MRGEKGWTRQFSQRLLILIPIIALKLSKPRVVQVARTKNPIIVRQGRAGIWQCGGTRRCFARQQLNTVINEWAASVAAYHRSGTQHLFLLPVFQNTKGAIVAVRGVHTLRYTVGGTYLLNGHPFFVMLMAVLRRCRHRFLKQTNIKTTMERGSQISVTIT